MSTGIDTEEKVYRSFTRILLERLIEPLVSWICGTPDLVLERLVNIIFSVRLDDKETSLIMDGVNKAQDKLVRGTLTKGGLVSNVAGL